jgi:hypothetical protein
VPKTFDVPLEGSYSPATVQPSSVAYARRAVRTADPEGQVLLTEIHFIGGVATITTPLSLREVRNLLDEALRYNA